MTGLPLNTAKNLEFYDVTIDINTSVLYKAGKQVPLGPRPFEVLLYLIENRERVVTKQELFEQVWGVEFVTDSALTQAIKDVRIALGDDAHTPKYIRTVHRKGYQFIASLNDNTQSANRRWRVLQIGLGIFAVGFLVVAISLWIKPAEPQYPPNTIVVLPFVNMSDDPGNEYFSDGITEELLNLLTMNPELRVIARTSSFFYKGKDARISDIARELKVRHVLEGSVRKAGNKVRITAQLIETGSETHLWSETYDRKLDDIFAIQNEIAVKVVDALKVQLLGNMPQADPADPKAYLLYLQAESVGNHLTKEALEQSNTILKQALTIAPDFARAWRLLARNYAVQAKKGILPRDEGFAMARAAINRALALDPELAVAHSWLGAFEASAGGDLELAASSLKHALRLEPGNSSVLAHASDFLSILNRQDEAIAVREYLLILDPLGPITHSSLAWDYVERGRLEDAIATFQTLHILSPDFELLHSGLGWAYLLKGEYDTALKAMHEELNEAGRLYGLAAVYDAMGQTKAADDVLKELIQKYGQVVPYWIASLLAYRGEIDRSFSWLENATGPMNLPEWITTKMWFENLYDDPRWPMFLEKIGRLPERLDSIDFDVPLPK